MWGPEVVSDSTFFIAVLTASLAGSAHCVGMCGGLVLASTTESWRTHWVYHLGRLSGYLALGAIAGLIGSWFLSRTLSGLVPTLTAFALMLGFVQLAKSIWKGSPPGHSDPSGLGKLARKLYPRALKLSPDLRAGTTGLLSVLLPCGWLYGFVLAATATGSPFRGVLVIFVFWLGTLPALTVGGVVFRKLLSQSQQSVRRAIALLFVALGLLTLSARFSSHQPTSLSPVGDVPAQLICH